MMDLMTCESPLNNSFQKDRLELASRGTLGRRRKPSRQNLKLLLSPSFDIFSNCCTPSATPNSAKGSTPIFQEFNIATPEFTCDFSSWTTLEQFTNSSAEIGNFSPTQISSGSSICSFGGQTESEHLDRLSHAPRIEYAVTSCDTENDSSTSNNLTTVIKETSCALNRPGKEINQLLYDAVPNSEPKYSESTKLANNTSYSCFFKENKEITNGVCNGIQQNKSKLNIPSPCNETLNTNHETTIPNGAVTLHRTNKIAPLIEWINSQDHGKRLNLQDRKLDKFEIKKSFIDNKDLTHRNNLINFQKQSLAGSKVLPTNDYHPADFPRPSSVKRTKSDLGRSAFLIQTWERRTRSDSFCRKNSRKSVHCPAKMPESGHKYKGTVQSIPSTRNAMQTSKDSHINGGLIPNTKAVRPQMTHTNGFIRKCPASEPEWISLSRKLCAKFSEGHIDVQSTDSSQEEPRGTTNNSVFCAAPDAPSAVLKTEGHLEKEPPWVPLSRKLCTKFLEEHIECPAQGKISHVASKPSESRIVDKVGNSNSKGLKPKKETEPEWISISRKLRAKFIESHINDPETMTLDNQLNASDPEETCSETSSDIFQESSQHSDILHNDVSQNDILKNRFDIVKNERIAHSPSMPNRKPNSDLFENDCFWEYRDFNTNEDCSDKPHIIPKLDNFADKFIDKSHSRKEAHQNNKNDLYATVNKPTMQYNSHSQKQFKNVECLNNDVLFAPPTTDFKDKVTERTTSGKKIITIEIVAHSGNALRTFSDTKRSPKRSANESPNKGSNNSFFNLTTWEEAHSGSDRLGNEVKRDLSKSMDNLHGPEISNKANFTASTDNKVPMNRDIFQSENCLDKLNSNTCNENHNSNSFTYNEQRTHYSGKQNDKTYSEYHEPHQSDYASIKDDEDFDWPEYNDDKDNLNFHENGISENELITKTKEHTRQCLNADDSNKMKISVNTTNFKSNINGYSKSDINNIGMIELDSLDNSTNFKANHNGNTHKSKIDSNSKNPAICNGFIPNKRKEFTVIKCTTDNIANSVSSPRETDSKLFAPSYKNEYVNISPHISENSNSGNLNKKSQYSQSTFELLSDKSVQTEDVFIIKQDEISKSRNRRTISESVAASCEAINVIDGNKKHSSTRLSENSNELKMKSMSLCDISNQRCVVYENRLKEHDMQDKTNSVANSSFLSAELPSIKFQDFEFESDIPLCAKLISKSDKYLNSITSSSNRNASPISESSHVYEDMFRETTSGPSDSETSSWKIVKNNNYYVNGRSSSMNDLDCSDSCSLSVKCDYASSGSEHSTLQSRHSSCDSSSFYVNLRDYDSHMLEPSLSKKKKTRPKTDVNRNTGVVSNSNPPTPESLRHLFTSPLHSIHSPVNGSDKFINRTQMESNGHYYSTTSAATSSAFKHGFDAQQQKPKRAERSSSLKIKDIAQGIMLTFRKLQHHAKNSNMSSSSVDVSHLAEFGSRTSLNSNKTKPKKDSKKEGGKQDDKKRWSFFENSKNDIDSLNGSSENRKTNSRRSSSDASTKKSSFDIFSSNKIHSQQNGGHGKNNDEKKNSNAKGKGKKSRNKSNETRTVPTVSRKVQQMADGTLYLVTTVSGDTAVPGVYSDSPDTSSELSGQKPVKTTGESNC